MYYSQAEQNIISTARSALVGRYPTVIRGASTPAISTASVQFWVQNRILHERVRPDSPEIVDARVLAAKLRSEQGTPIFIVSTDFTEMLRLPPLTRLWSKYAAGSNGLGWWDEEFAENESIPYAMLLRDRAEVPVVIRIAWLRSLLTTYRQQEQAAASAASQSDQPKKMQKLSAEGATSVEDRKSMASFGTCYRCAAPKPRGVLCAICGYMPRSGGR